VSRVGQLFLALLTAVPSGCSAESSRSDDILPMKLCITFPSQEEGRIEVIEYLEQMRFTIDGKHSDETQAVYFKSDDGRFFAIYHDTKPAYGNILQTYWRDGNFQSVDERIEKDFEHMFDEVDRCSSDLESSISPFDF